LGALSEERAAVLALVCLLGLCFALVAHRELCGGDHVVGLALQS